jgi:hypothetical protein
MAETRRIGIDLGGTKIEGIVLTRWTGGTRERIPTERGWTSHRGGGGPGKRLRVHAPEASGIGTPVDVGWDGRSRIPTPRA